MMNQSQREKSTTKQLFFEEQEERTEEIGKITW
jgi:hypothetical protein